MALEHRHLLKIPVQNGHPWTSMENQICMNAHYMLIMTKIHEILRQRLLNLHKFQIAFDTLQALCRHQDLLKEGSFREITCEATAWRCLECICCREQFVLESVCSVQLQIGESK